MAITINNSLLENTLRLLEAGPLSSVEICRRVLMLERAPALLADSVVAAMLEPDPRFERLGDGRWAACGGRLSPAMEELSRVSFVVVDVETTGFRPPADRVIELGMVRVEQGQVVDSFETLLNPRRPIPGPITSLTGISWEMVSGSPTFEKICSTFLGFLGDSVFVAHNAPFDWRFVQSEVILATGCRLLNPRLCTRILARRLLPEVDRRSLDELARFFNLGFTARHRALGDALVTAEILLRLLERALEKGINTLDGLYELLRPVGRKKATGSPKGA
ncbi:MAG TPA: 3'-5' exonuclease [Candidatus Glassbacteria bacterium]|nr:3'-5' exonuclease [Candidatus Glassbacteria bacterium]